MSLVIEDGTGKPDAQTYVGPSEARAFAAARGVSLPPVPSSGEDPVEPMLIRAIDYIESLEPRMKGRRKSAEQALSYPRTGVRIGCEYEVYPDDKIPANLVAAQCHAVLAIAQGYDLQPIIDPNRQLVKRRKVDVLETEYFGPKEMGAGYGATPTFPALESSLRPLLKNGGAVSLIARRG